MAIEAALVLDDEALDGLAEMVLCTDEPVDEPGLVTTALDVDASVSTRVGATQGLEALGDAEDQRLVLAAGSTVGGAGVAVRVEPGEGVPVTGPARASRPSDSPTGRAALDEALDPLDAPKRRLPAGVGDDPDATARVGEAGPAGPLVELLAALDEGQPVATGAIDAGRAVALATREGRVERSSWDSRPADVTPEDHERLVTRQAPPWNEASQGAYVSMEEYEADPAERYAARATGAGTVETATTIRAGPPGEFLRQHEQGGSYDVVIVDVDGGDRAIRQSASPPGRVAIGDRTQPVLRRVFSMEGQTRYGLKARPVDGADEERSEA
jgi:uncharacterized OB-fold protein